MVVWSSFCRTELFFSFRFSFDKRFWIGPGKILDNFLSCFKILFRLERIWAALGVLVSISLL